jgi:hypothetical protein
LFGEEIKNTKPSPFSLAYAPFLLKEAQDGVNAL